MFQNISAINYLIYSVGLGFIAAIIITNIQRSALSKFINSLISNNCYSPDSSTTLTDINLKGFNACIIKSAVKNQFGLKKSISVVCESVKSKDKLEEIFDKTDDVKYYLSENCDLELLKKRYNYSALSKMTLTLLITALIAVVLIASILSDFSVALLTMSLACFCASSIAIFSCSSFARY